MVEFFPRLSVLSLIETHLSLGGKEVERFATALSRYPCTINGYQEKIHASLVGF